MTRNKVFLSTTVLALGAVAVAATMQLGASSSEGASGYQLLARHGADDPAGDDRGGKRGGKGADDPAGHTSLSTGTMYQMARHGADDPAGDDRGGRRGKGGGNGADDGVGHT